MKKNIGQHYFAKQTARCVLNIVFGSVTALGVIVISVVIWFWGAWLLLIGIGGLIFTNSGRVSDKDYDRYMFEKIRSDDTEAPADFSAKAYDIETCTCLKRGKDKLPRTDVICEAKVFLEKKNITVHLRKAQMNDEQCTLIEFEKPRDQVAVRLDEIEIADSGKKAMKMTIEASDGQSIAFPVGSDYATEQFAEEINARSAYAKRKA